MVERPARGEVFVYTDAEVHMWVQSSALGLAPIGITSEANKHFNVFRFPASFATAPLPGGEAPPTISPG